MDRLHSEAANDGTVPLNGGGQRERKQGERDVVEKRGSVCALSALCLGEVCRISRILLKKERKRKKKEKERKKIRNCST